jgi:hypothetical protein
VNVVRVSSRRELLKRHRSISVAKYAGVAVGQCPVNPAGESRGQEAYHLRDAMNRQRCDFLRKAKLLPVISPRATNFAKFAESVVSGQSRFHIMTAISYERYAACLFSVRPGKWCC